MILQGILHKFTTYVNTSLSCRVSDNDIYAHIFVIFLVCIFFISFNMKGFYYEITKEKNFTNWFGYGISCW